MDSSVVDDSLIVRGERKGSEEVKEKGYHYKETAYGRFERRLALPKGVDGDRSKPATKMAVLKVLIPPPVELAGKKIPILIEEGQTKLAA